MDTANGYGVRHKRIHQTWQTNDCDIHFVYVNTYVYVITYVYIYVCIYI